MKVIILCLASLLSNVVSVCHVYLINIRHGGDSINLPTGGVFTVLQIQGASKIRDPNTLLYRVFMLRSS